MVCVETCVFPHVLTGFKTCWKQWVFLKLCHRDLDLLQRRQRERERDRESEGETEREGKESQRM